MKYSLLYVEDDKDLAELNIGYLSNEGFNVIYASTGEKALDMFQKFSPDIILLDIVMQGLDGYEVAKKIRAKNNRVPILFLTSLVHKDYAVKGLKTGADDFIRKDMDIEEIVARIYRSLRVIPKNSAKFVITSNTYLDVSTQEVVSFDIRSRLSFREYDLLYFLAANANTVHSREVIISNIWGDRLNGDIYLRKSLSKLRKILSSDREIKIRTLRNSGIVLLIS